MKLSRGNNLARKNMQTPQYGFESFSNLEAKIFVLLPGEIKNNSSLSVFNKKIRKWIPEKSPSEPYQTYIKNVGYI